MKKNFLYTFLLLAFAILFTGSSTYYSPLATRDNNLTLGNPSNAQSDTSFSANYLIVKDQYALSYNSKTHTANWVSWHLSQAWKGNAKRSSSFYREKTLPVNWYRASEDDYDHSGFDRGHLCPSDDRDGNPVDNKETFKMINIVPQAPAMNQRSWKELEDYSRSLLGEYELYIIAGTYGSGGTGDKGLKKSITKKNINVPQYLWKIIVVLPVGTDDLNRIDRGTRVIAVLMPNTVEAGSASWTKYRVSIDQLEKITGYDFLSLLPERTQVSIERRTDDEVSINR